MRVTFKLTNNGWRQERVYRECETKDGRARKKRRPSTERWSQSGDGDDWWMCFATVFDGNGDDDGKIRSFISIFDFSPSLNFLEWISSISDKMQWEISDLDDFKSQRKSLFRCLKWCSTHNRPFQRNGMNTKHVEQHKLAPLLEHTWCSKLERFLWIWEINRKTGKNWWRREVVYLGKINGLWRGGITVKCTCLKCNSRPTFRFIRIILVSVYFLWPNIRRNSLAFKQKVLEPSYGAHSVSV